ncbi:MAG: hypothetical protein AAGF10_00100, partial [Verrucomicrobiota bacterium]
MCAFKKRFVWLFVMSSFATPQSFAQAVADNTMSLAVVRALRDTAEVPHDLKRNDWSLVVITPHPHSGSLTTKAMIDPATRQLVFSEPSEVLFSGRWTVLVGDARDSGGEFSWTESVHAYTSNDAPLVTIPFTQGGAILCKIDNDAKGKNIFSRVHLLPHGDAWVDGARDILLDEGFLMSFFDADGAPRMRDIIRQKNPLLTIMIVNMMIHSDSVGQIEMKRFVRDVWLNSEHAQPALAYVLASSLNNRDITMLRGIIEETESAQVIQRISDGLLAA